MELAYDNIRRQLWSSSLLNDMRELLTLHGHCELDDGGRPYCVEHATSLPCQIGEMRKKYLDQDGK